MNLPIVRAIACACAFTATGIGATSFPSAAGGATSSVQQLTSESPLSQNKPHDKAAQEWGLTSKEYERYQEVMQGPRGVYSPGLDPLTALGIEARSDSERRRFAELQVQAERQRVERELAYQRAYDEAYQRLFPGIKAIEISSSPMSQTGSSGSGPALEGNGRIALFVKDDCLPCIDQVKRLQTSQTPFDLYFVGSQNDDERIRRWAILAGVDPSSVKSRQITLNHDQGRWVRLGLGGSLPATVTQVNGSWRRQ
ncbi:MULTISPECIES: TIGR03759 family integrating conjugative element protein [Pseudomonas]|uniref:TIGR03759 family integrating conjugative element protein n=1 Tax=Pseudomonas TaxID=286 RepID=UPI0003DC8C4D|nr:MULTISPECIES: TIGR03759 family integrating conjugative element protein [Pseudomonas]ETK22715.1 integrating conjugative element protein [Pseudomonas sp. FH1]MDB1111911.1 TIGR03759 family integrating conjugative element protein [Pseudomonas extremaustralis]